jgi:hypothetical protein
MDAMEKGETSPIPASPSPPTPPPPSACDVLQPLSQTGVFPSSGAVAARARELMQMQMQLQTGKASPSSPGGSAMMETEEAEGAEGGSRRSSNSSSSSGGDCGGEVGGSVQKRVELVQQIREVDEDGNGVRTWRRVVTEYS